MTLVGDNRDNNAAFVLGAEFEDNGAMSDKVLRLHQDMSSTQSIPIFELIRKHECPTLTRLT